MRLMLERPEGFLHALGFGDERGCLDSFFSCLRSLEDEADEALEGSALCRLYDGQDPLDFQYSVEPLAVDVQPSPMWRRGVIRYSPAENRWGIS